jgi:hypothetical protein
VENRVLAGREMEVLGQALASPASSLIGLKIFGVAFKDALRKQ